MQKKKSNPTEQISQSSTRKEFLTDSFKMFLPVALAMGATQSCSKQKSVLQSKDVLPEIKWSLASSFPRSLDILFGAAEYFAEKVKELSNGKFTIRTHPAGELVPGLQVFDAIQQGTVELGQTVGYYYIGKNPAFAIEAGVPFGLDVRQQMAWMDAEGQALLNELFSRFNIVSFPMGNTGAQMGGWFRNPINSLADLKGLRMRIPGLGGKVMAELGINVQNLGGDDIYSALERGAIDATEWVGPYDDEKLSFYKVAKYYYYPGWWEPGSQFSLYINQDKWVSLPPTYQAILVAATRDTYLKVMSRYDTENPLALQRLLKNGVQLKRYSSDIISKGKEIATRLMEENAAADADYRKIYASWKKYKEASTYWFDEVEGSIVR